ncbi:oxidoreductase [Geothermobacter ehrlichii]|uniref:oxidoreductase n=1 Tax=Geothermobacter ehrlichii TaxID=213224 RepID=UPI0011E88D81|nr:FAD-dependent oxidoreductase [Geothermobacter ehrlichii]
MANLDHLFKPINIQGVEIRNRVLITAHVVQYAQPDGTPTERNINYLVERAKNGVGLICTEATYILKDRGRDFYNQLGLYDDKQIPMWKKLVDAVHKEGAKIAVQIFHPGRQGDTANTGVACEAPSAIPCPIMQEPTEEMTVARIKDVVQGFAKCAKRVKLAGADFVELHGAHGYLIEQFMSPYSNKRTDEYGGSFENRMRFVKEIYLACREEVGEDYPIGIRISADEFAEGGLGLTDTQEIAKFLEEMGFAYISVSAGTYSLTGLTMMLTTMEVPFAPLEYLAAGIKKAVKYTPVFTVNSIVDPVLADQILEKGSADMVGMTRAHLCDPEILKKAKEGNLDDIRACVRCNHGCIDHLFVDIPISCTQNPQAGREKELAIIPAPQKKKVVVVGGGPGGMTAARIAKLRGHEVVIFEKEKELGGWNRYAQMVPTREEFGGVTRWMIMQIEKLGIKVMLGQEATVDAILQEKPDAVIVASGSRLNVPPIRNIYDSAGNLQKNVVFGTDVLKGDVEVGNKVVIIGANDIGLEIGEFLGEKGKKVTVVDFEKAPSQEILGGVTWFNFLARIEEAGVEMVLGKAVTEIKENGVVIDRVGKAAPGLKEGADGSDPSFIEADTIVIGTGRKPNDSLFYDLHGKVKELSIIGDAQKPKITINAVRTGFEAALHI